MSYIIRNPINNKEVLEVISLMKKCFPQMDKAYFIKRILGDSSYDRSHTFILVENNIIVSHAHFFTKKIWWKTRRVPFIGLGFVCTLPEFRNRGYATELLRHIIKGKDASLLGLFTKIPAYYKKFGFKIVPRKQVIIKRGHFRDSLTSTIKIRRFNLNKDILSVMNMHKNYFRRQAGIISRSFKDWRNQFSYFDEDKRFFLVAESGSRLKAYIRCKIKKAIPERMEVVEYASINKRSSLIPHFVSYLFNRMGINEVKVCDNFLKYTLEDICHFDDEIDTKMMIRFNQLYQEEDVKPYQLCFLESDGF